MPNCSKCNAVQARMNKGNLCKQCFHTKIHISKEIINSDNDSLNSTAIDDDNRTVIDIIKQHMEKQSQWNRETRTLLLNQI